MDLITSHISHVAFISLSEDIPLWDVEGVDRSGETINAGGGDFNIIDPLLERAATWVWAWAWCRRLGLYMGRRTER
jgi:hypothetical protein